MAIVTIARQHGSGGRLIGREVASLLQADYVDKEVLALAARKAGVEKEAVAEWDEKVIPQGDRLARAIRGFLANSADFLALRAYGRPPYLTPYPSAPMDQKRYLAIISDVLKQLAQRGNIVIVGRGANIILRDMPNLLRVLVIAPIDVRVRQVMQDQKLAAEEAEADIRRVDRGRSEFARDLFGVDWCDPANYDLVVNTGRLSHDQAARLIAETAAGMERKAPASQAAA